MTVAEFVNHLMLGALRHQQLFGCEPPCVRTVLMVIISRSIATVATQSLYVADIKFSSAARFWNWVVTHLALDDLIVLLLLWIKIKPYQVYVFDNAVQCAVTPADT